MSFVPFRVIPILLLDGNSFVKTKNFRKPVYLGDPINIVKIFNTKFVDELVILNISKNPEIDFSFLERIAQEAFMPVTFGGQVNSLQSVKNIFSCGFEKISFQSALFDNPELIKQAVSIYGSQSLLALLIFTNLLWVL